MKCWRYSFGTQGTLQCGILQGSNLGMLLFQIHVNDLPSCLEHSTVRMFADDTTLTVSRQNTKEIELTCNLELKKLSEWFLANQMSLNAKKTDFMLIASDSKLSNVCNNPRLQIDNTYIKRVNTSKSLGVNID